MDLTTLIDGPSALIVGGGTLLATVLRSGFGDCRITLVKLAGLGRRGFDLDHTRAELGLQIQEIRQDGLLRAVPLPGHAPGMVGLLVQEDAGLTVLAADAAWSVRAGREERPVHPLARVAFHDPALEATSGAALRAFLHANPGARLHVSHDAPEGWT